MAAASPSSVGVAVTRSSPGDGFTAPDWWQPWSDQNSLMAQTRETVKKLKDASYMTWLDDRGREQVTLTFDGVWRMSGVIARRMKDDWDVALGDRVLLCYLPGTAFIVAYWACLRLRAVAVPAYPPDPSKLEIGLKKLALVAKSCDAKLCLTEKTLEQMRMALSLTHAWPAGLVWRRTDDVVLKKNTRDIGDDVDAPVDPSAVAFLQYTSGSTGDPKGVMLTFDNMWHNINEMYLPGQLRHLRQRGVDLDNERVVGVSWLPQFHDTGLVLCIVAPFVAGYHMINFSPLTFLRSPLLWMEALTKYKAHWSAAPDFSYELCVRRILDGSVDNRKSSTQKKIDLSIVRQLACGAGERCRPVQLARFLETFSRYGLRDDVYIPNYGLAEHVVGTCGCATGIKLSKSRPDLACCGEDFQCDLRIVDPVTHVEKKPGEAGEIWISSRSVAKGYWGKPELSREAFEARLVGDERQHCYLRTGDEGYFELDATHGPQLFICGRIKDVIIVGGKNYFPEDIEVAAQEANRDHIRPGCVAAFAAQDGGTATGDETVTCVFELRKKAAAHYDDEQKLSKLSEDVRRAVGIASGLLPGRIVIIVERSIPKTTSGKVQRRQTRSLLDSKGLKVLFDSAYLHPATHAKSSSGFFLSHDSWLARSLDSACKFFLSADNERSPPPQDQTQKKDLPLAPPPPSPQSLDTAARNDAENGHGSVVVVGEEVTETTRVVVAAIQEVASGQCTASTPFHELGLSSRQTIELLRRVEKDVQVELPPALVFSCPTPASLAAEICKLRRGDGDDDVNSLADRPELSSRQPNVARIEVLSVAARLPGGCDDVARDLRSLISGKIEAASGVPFDRWDVNAVEMRTAHSAARARASYGAFCRGADAFEPAQFGMRLAEAGALDPQQRLFLERSYEALVYAGYRKACDSSVRRSLFARTKESGSLVKEATPLAGANVAVCLGMMNMDAAFSLAPEEVGPHDLTGNGYASAGSRLSFTFDMRGPCVVVDTACSASLVAGHAASNFVSSHEADAGLFAGVSLMLAPSFVHVGAAVAAMTSETGRCHTFDANADGYCRGEGCAVVVIGRSPEDSEEDASKTTMTVTAKGFAVKHNGQSATFTALNASAQTRLMEATRGARSTTSVEAHGTGTKLGDPIEISGLSAFQKFKRFAGSLISGIKANLGHTEPTAGVAGYVASMLVAISHEQQPNALLRVANPVAHFERIESLSFATDSTLLLAGESFEHRKAVSSCGVSSFGYSGIIAHAVIDATLRHIDNGMCSSSERPYDIGGQREKLRRRDPREINQARTLGKQLLIRKNDGPNPRHSWLHRRSSSTFEVKITKPFIDRASYTSHLIEIALAMAEAIGATSVMDVALTPTTSTATVCVLEKTEIRIETKDGSIALSAQAVTTPPEALAPLSQRTSREASPQPDHSVLLRDEVGAAWRIGSRNEEMKGFVVQLPRRTDSPTLRAAAVEATRQLTSVMASQNVEWTSVSKIILAADKHDDESRRAWNHVVCSEKHDDKTISVDCDISTSGPLISLLGASFRRSRMKPACVEGAAVYELGWHESAEVRQSPMTTLFFLSASHAPSSRDLRSLQRLEQVAFSDRMPPRDSDLWLVASREEHITDAWYRHRGDATKAPPSLSHSLRAAVSKKLDLLSLRTLDDGKLRRLEPYLSVASANAYEGRQSTAAVHQPAVVVDLGNNYLLPLVMRAFAGTSYVVLLRDASISTSVAIELSAFTGPKPIIMVGRSGTVPVHFLPLRNAEEQRVVVGHGDASFVNGLDSSRVLTIFFAGTDVRYSWLAQRRRFAGCRSLAQVGSLSTSSMSDARVLSACVQGASMVSWATTILTPSAGLRSSLLPSRGVVPAMREVSRRESRGQYVPKDNIRKIVCEVVERVIGPEALTTSFVDLGIDSLQGTEVAHELSSRLGREVPPTLLLDVNGIDEIVDSLSGDARENDEEDLKALDVSQMNDGSTAMATRLLPASVKCAESTPDQELLFWMSRKQKYYTWLPVTAIGDLVGDLDVEALERAITAVVGRHEALRSRLMKVPFDDLSIRTLFAVDNNPCRYPRLIVRDAGSAEDARRAVQAFHDEFENDAFSADPPFRALLVRYPSAPRQEHEASKQSFVARNGVLYVSTSHAVSDGWSQQLLYNDLVAAYNNNGSFPTDRAEPARRYCEFLVGHNEEVAKRSGEAAIEKQLENYVKATKLPSRWPTVCSADVIVDTLFESGSLLHSDFVSVIDAARLSAIEAKLQHSSTDLGRASLPSLVLAAYVAALGDAQFGSAVAVQYSHTGRIGHPELTETYGQLATDMNVVIPPADTSSAMPQLGPFIENVHKSVVRSLSLASVPYSLAYRATLDRQGRAALPPQFNWYDRYSDVPLWRGLEAKEISVDQTRMRLKTFNIGAIYLMGLVQSDGSLCLKFFFNQNVYSLSTIQLAADRMQEFLDRFAAQGLVSDECSCLFSQSCSQGAQLNLFPDE